MFEDYYEVKVHALILFFRSPTDENESYIPTET